MTEPTASASGCAMDGIFNWAASCSAVLAICWNCSVSEPHHCIGSTTPALSPAVALALEAAGLRVGFLGGGAAS